MAGRRRKGRKTHKVVDDVELAKGKVSESVKRLSRDIRKAYRPWTAVNLTENKRATLKDYTAVGGLLNISHMVLVKQKDSKVYLSFLRTKSGAGPSCHFKVLSYSLIQDVQGCQAKPRMCEQDFITSPIIVTQGFDTARKKQIKSKKRKASCLLAEQPSKTQDDHEDELSAEILKEVKEKIFLQAFPSISRTSDDASFEECVRSYNGVRRVLLFSYQGNRIFDVRHYAILKTTKFIDLFNIKKKQKKRFKKEIKEEDEVKVKQEVLDEEEKFDFLRQNLSLIEIGPRITMELIKFNDKLDSNFALNETEAAELGAFLDESELSFDEPEEAPSSEKGDRKVHFADDCDMAKQ